VPIRVERPAGPELGVTRTRVFDADGWDVSRAGNLEIRKGNDVIAEIASGDWLLAEEVPDS